MATTVIQHLLGRLKDLEIRDIFGVPGDYAFPVDDAICDDPELRWVGCSSELGAAYAADGYARVRGMAALCTTYGVGEIGALSGIAGSYAEHCTVVHIVGMPSRQSMHDPWVLHHTLGSSEADLFFQMTRPVVCAGTILTPETCIAEVDRVLTAAQRHRRPVYIGVPADVASKPVQSGPVSRPAPRPPSHPAALEAAVSAIVEKVAAARTACILPGIFLVRLGLRGAAAELIEASGLPFATMFMDKTALDETHPSYIGMYDGRLMDPEIRNFVESCDCVLSIAVLPSDFNTGAFTAHIDRGRSVSIREHQVRVGHAVFSNVEIPDVLAELLKRLPRRTDIHPPKTAQPDPPRTRPDDPIAAGYLYPAFGKMLRQYDIVVAETGTPSMGAAFLKMPRGATFHNQTLWGAIGWATPAAFGCALAAPERRTILLTGEGSHQLTAQEIGQFHRYGLKPVVFVVENGGYLIERMLGSDPEKPYNDLAPWRYAELPAVLGCEGWLARRVATCGELERVLSELDGLGRGAYIEVQTPRMSAPPLAEALRDHRQSLYQSG